MTRGFGFNMSYTVNFERATEDYDSGRNPGPLRLMEEGKDALPVTVEGGDGYVGELRYFLDAVRTGKAPSVVTAQDGVTSVEICAAEEKSVSTRHIIRL